MAARKSQTLQVPRVPLPPEFTGRRIVRGGFPPAERAEYIRKDKTKKSNKRVK